MACCPPGCALESLSVCSVLEDRQVILQRPVVTWVAGVPALQG